MGLNLADDPDYKDAILEPLKLKGIADITENALIVDFKLVIRANSASGIESEAKWRILQACRSEGIELSSSLPSSAQLKLDSLGDQPDRAVADAATTGEQRQGCPCSWRARASRPSRAVCAVPVWPES